MAPALPLSPAADLKDRPLHRDTAPTKLSLDSWFFCHKYFPSPRELTLLIHREGNVADGNCHMRGRGVSFPWLSGSLRCVQPGPSGTLQNPDSSGPQLSSTPFTAFSSLPISLFLLPHTPSLRLLSKIPSLHTRFYLRSFWRKNETKTPRELSNSQHPLLWPIQILVGTSGRHYPLQARKREDRTPSLTWLHLPNTRDDRTTRQQTVQLLTEKIEAIKITPSPKPFQE